MADKSLTKIGRLAMRHEGDYWNAYYAMPDTMAGAVWLGCIAMAAIHGKEVRKLAFMDLMREAVADILESKTGHRPTYPNPPHAAPEHERGGNG